MEANNMTIGELCATIIKEAERLGYSGNFIWNNLDKGFSAIRGYYRSHELLCYTIEDTLNCLEVHRAKYHDKNISRSYFQHVQLAVKRMNEFAVTGTLSIDANRVQSKIFLSAKFEKLLDQFITFAGYGPNTICDAQWVVKKYLKYFSDTGHLSLETLTLENVRDFIMKTALQVKTSTLHDIFGLYSQSR